MIDLVEILISSQGFVDGGEEANNALKREFLEETMNSEEATEEQKKEMEEKCNKLFQNGVEVRLHFKF